MLWHSGFARDGVSGNGEGPLRNQSRPTPRVGIIGLTVHSLLAFCSRCCHPMADELARVGHIAPSTHEIIDIPWGLPGSTPTVRPCLKTRRKSEEPSVSKTHQTTVLRCRRRMGGAYGSAFLSVSPINVTAIDLTSAAHAAIYQ